MIGAREKKPKRKNQTDIATMTRGLNPIHVEFDNTKGFADGWLDKKGQLGAAIPRFLNEH